MNQHSELHDNHAHESHSSVKGYVIGFVLSVILTLIAFGIVMSGNASHDTKVMVAVIAGVVQILVHLYYFLHMSNAPEERWNVISFVFAVIVIGIVVGGSLWIMSNTHHNLMMQ